MISLSSWAFLALLADQLVTVLLINTYVLKLQDITQLPGKYFCNSHKL